MYFVCQGYARPTASAITDVTAKPDRFHSTLHSLIKIKLKVQAAYRRTFGMVVYSANVAVRVKHTGKRNLTEFIDELLGIHYRTGVATPAPSISLAHLRQNHTGTIPKTPNEQSIMRQ